MNEQWKAAFEAEMAAANNHFKAGCLSRAMHHLRRAHVLGQHHVLPHVRSHWAMLKIGLARRSAVDAWGQLLRIVLGAAGSALGIVTVGNTGDSEVSMFRRLPLDPELASLMQKDQAQH